jgi:hypothetical protein
MGQRRVVDVDEPASTVPCAVHLRRPDGLDVEVSGDGRFVSAILERLLVALGVLAPAPPP